MEKNWRFADPENAAVITLKQIVNEGEPILHVTHDSDDGGRESPHAFQSRASSCASAI